MKDSKVITIETEINSPVAKVWDYYTNPIHIVNWNNASEDWHTPHAFNDLKVGGRFNSRMEAKDGSAGFDFEGTYNTVKTNEQIEYTMDDGRKVNVLFSVVKENNSDSYKTKVEIEFDAEQTHSLEMQKEGWQSILNNFKTYVETH